MTHNYNKTYEFCKTHMYIYAHNTMKNGLYNITFKSTRKMVKKLDDCIKKYNKLVGDRKSIKVIKGNKKNIEICENKLKELNECMEEIKNIRFIKSYKYFLKKSESIVAYNSKTKKDFNVDMLRVYMINYLYICYLKRYMRELHLI